MKVLNSALIACSLAGVELCNLADQLVNERWDMATTDRTPDSIRIALYGTGGRN
ncbi:hypothetical protein [Paraburkholderia aromaticivorans]|uniref:hypothetical protein n=1 Tax=Paraburkholderia aromaticivorans TaxID=2026199 RepID=UPI001455EA61|nr:hypothetical protein [Paraburkholderia aromaticivorans]